MEKQAVKKLNRLLKKNSMLKDYTILGQLNDSMTTMVYLAQKNTVSSAVKITTVFPWDQKLFEAALQEIKMLRILLPQERIVDILEDHIITYENSRIVFLFLERLFPLPVHMSPETVRMLGLDLCDALIACHENKILHRDIQPKNILMTQDDRFKLCDFASSCFLENGAASGCTGAVAYMAPEVFHKQSYGIQSDLYSLGIVLYRLANHRIAPFASLHSSEAERFQAVEKRLSGEPFSRPKAIPPELFRVIEKACSYEPAMRYASAEEMKEALEKISL